jgi:hypothetical protein
MKKTSKEPALDRAVMEIEVDDETRGRLLCIPADTQTLMPDLLKSFTESLGTEEEFYDIVEGWFTTTKHPRTR